MAEAKWPVCQEESKANVHRPWPCDSDTADRPLRPGRLPSTSERIAWERAGAARGLWLCCVGRPSPMGIGLPPRLAKDPSALPPFRKFISGFALAGSNTRRVGGTLGTWRNTSQGPTIRASCISYQPTLNGRPHEPSLRSGKAHSPTAFAADCGTRVPEDGGCRQRSLRPERATLRH